MNTVSSYIDALRRLRRDRTTRLEWLRDGPVDGKISNNSATLLLPGGYLPQADARGNAGTAPAMDLMGQLATHPASAAVAGRRAGEREHRAHRDAHAVRARAQPDRLAACPTALSTERPVPDRTPRRRRGAAVHHLQRVPPRARRAPAPVPRLRPERQPVALERVRDRRLPRAQHGPRRVRAGSARRAPTARRSSQAFQAPGIAVEREGGKSRARRSRSSSRSATRTCSSRVGLGPCSRASADERQYKNDEQIDDSMRSVLFQIPKPGIADPPSAVTPTSSRAASRACRISARSTSSAAATTGCRPTTSCASPTGSSRRRRSRRSRASRPPASRAAADQPRTTRSTIPTSSTSRSCSDDDGNTVPPGTRRGAGGRRSSASAGRRLAARLKAIYGPGTSTRSTRSSGCSPSRTSAAPSSASCSSRCGSSSSRRCATATGSST